MFNVEYADFCAKPSIVVAGVHRPFSVGCAPSGSRCWMSSALMHTAVRDTPENMALLYRLANELNNLPDAEKLEYFAHSVKFMSEHFGEEK